MDHQPLAVLAINAGPLAALVEPCLASRHRKATAELGQLLRALHAKTQAAGPPPAPPPAPEVRAACHSTLPTRMPSMHVAICCL